MLASLKREPILFAFLRAEMLIDSMYDEATAMMAKEMCLQSIQPL
jgi:hypothetical protein